MRTAIALAVWVALAAGCGSGGAAPDPPCHSETVTSQQLPTMGFSAIAAPEAVTLDPNPALIDGNLAAAAELDLGTAAGDTFRNIGARFADAATVVNRVDVHVDRTVPPDVAAALTWTAYRSDDNVAWAQAPVANVAFETFANRFEIRVAAGSSRHVKAVTRPLPPSASADPALEALFVTEVLFYVTTTTCTP